MIETKLTENARAYLEHLCRAIPGRMVGSAGNRAATEFFARTLASWGFEVATPSFPCLDWVDEGADLLVGQTPFDALPCPYTLGGVFAGPLTACKTTADLETADLHGRIVLLHGELARRQLMPKHFPFYNPEEHRRIINLLETRRPLAIIAATGRDPEMVGSLYPFPLFEDGDFDIPAVYLTDVAGHELLKRLGQVARLEIRARRIPAEGCNVSGRKGDISARRVVVMAHIDAKRGTPGALDNAAGVVVLLLLAGLLKDYDGRPAIELVAMNGEDYYSSPGEQLYLATNAGRWEEIVLGINIDGVGLLGGRMAYSLYDLPPPAVTPIHLELEGWPGIVPGEPWYQGDHALFLMNSVPALAFTTERLADLMAVVHTPEDTPDLVDPQQLETLAQALHRLLQAGSQ